ncbi:TetR/AcrR family transcriptional regulator [Elizabethkingia anophelis]|nr:TetR/AcrR family transcriptional regulator [Elizabethkingia anophelis]MCT3782445.1 TetR/AcrR family transcriptional regulator [Elizabethkingia anophelis]MCT3789679.1 TetR/AcrR family transcriptional regulator [Elizabethkingia anophelis]MCT3793382.1 TetR/AcrR family transcriptional regulator [Elizabethkingia anophelis]MCT3796765.1 TetR/AcrR family transcriptional regulator [Elizabethkingia anophelis]
MPRNKEFDYHDKLEKVRNLFWEKGYNATSMDDIVDTMGLNRSSIYNTYGNKHQLFVECLTHYAKMKTEQYQVASQYKGSAYGALCFTVHDVMDQTIKDKKACLIIRTIFELGDTDPLVKNLIVSNTTILENIFKKLVEQAKADGDIKQNLAPEIASRYILSGFSGFYKHYILSGSKKEVDEMIDFMLLSMKA